MKKIFAALAVVSALSGCAQPMVQRISFPASEYAALATTGTGVVSGQAFLRTLGGDVKYGAGSSVYLLPATSYTDQWFNENYLGGRALSEPDPRASQGKLETQADGSGNFVFRDVPRGSYYLSTIVTWQAPTQFGLATQGGVVAKKIEVSDGKETRVILTR